MSLRNSAFLTSFALLYLLATNGANAAVLAYYNFDDAAATVTDNSGNAATGTLNNGATYTADGGGASGAAGDRALTVAKASSQFVTLPGASFASPQSTDAMSLNFWAFGDAAVFPAQSTAFYFGDAAGSTGRQFQAHLPWIDSNVYFDAAGGTGAANRINKLAVPAEFEGSWRHWTFVKSGTTSSIYLDGQLWHTGTTTDNNFEAITTAFIGRDPAGTNFWDGEIDDFAVWDEGLSAEKAALIHGLDFFREVAPNDTAIDNVLAAFNDGPGGAGVAGGRRWYYRTGLAGGLGATGTDQDHPFIVLDGAGNGVIALAAVPEPTTFSLLVLGLLGLAFRRTYRRGLPAIALALSLIAGTSSAQAGLLAYYNFDDAAATVTDNSGNGANGTLNNGATYTGLGTGASGKAGDRALTLNRAASQSVTLPFAKFTSMDTTNAASLTMWAFGDAAVLPQNTTGFYFGDAAGAARQFQAHFPWTSPVPATLYFDVGGGATVGVNRIQQTAAASEFEGAWAHWAFVKSGATSTVYRNGQVWLTGSTTDVNIETISAAFIGRDTGGNYWDGEMDDFAVWDEGLAADRIALIHGLDLFNNVAPNSSAIDDVLNAFNSGPGSEASAGGNKWKYVTGLTGGLGATGGSIGAGDAFIVLDGLGNGVAFGGVPEPSTALMLAMGLLGLTIRRRRSGRRWTIGRDWWTARLKAEAEHGRDCDNACNQRTLKSARQSRCNTATAPTRALAFAIPLLGLLAVCANAGTLELQLRGVDYNPATGDWIDISGMGNNATQASAPNRPALVSNATPNQLRPVVQFDGTSDFLSLPNFASGFTAGEVFVLFQRTSDPASTASQSGLWQFGTAAQGTHVPWTDGVIYDGFGTNARKTTVNPTDSLADWSIYNVTSAAGDWTSRLNGSEIFTTATNTVAFSTTPFLGRHNGGGGPYYLAGDIAEIRVYSGSISPAERTAIYRELLDFNFQIPEPSTALLLGIGLVGLGARRRNRLRTA